MTKDDLIKLRQEVYAMWYYSNRLYRRIKRFAQKYISNRTITFMNKQDKILLKLSEEMSELLTRVLQHLNKEKNYTDKILSEIEDVQTQLNLLKNII